LNFHIHLIGYQSCPKKQPSSQMGVSTFNRCMYQFTSAGDTNDGSYFAYVSFWFFDDGPIVYIYKKGSTKIYSAQDLRLTSKGLRETASHKLWLKDGGDFWPTSGVPSKFIINTEQGERSIEL